MISHNSSTAAAPRRRLQLAVVVAGMLAFGALGSVGLVRYLRGYWLYRGFPQPRDPAFVVRAGAVGTTQRFYVTSSALGGRRQPVDVYLPAGYGRHPGVRYPVFYLLHGFPGRPGAFLLTVRLGVVEDILLAQHRIRPFILVMPFGSTGTFTDKEWANGVGRNQAWETFVARDLVRTVDRRYQTIGRPAGRAIGGLSEGGYGAINIALHHPGEFRVVESWSGYEQAANIRTLFGGQPALLRRNSPLDLLPSVAPRVFAAKTYFWLYSGADDPLSRQNVKFAAQLTRAGIPNRLSILRGGHNWALWRARAAFALLAASSHLGHA